mgnify:CR=1 FL=1
MALARMKKILVINNHDSFTYNLVDLIRQLQVRFDVVSVEDLFIKLMLMAHYANLFSS